MILALDFCWLVSLEGELRYFAATMALLNNNNWIWIVFYCGVRSRRFYSRAGCWRSQADRKANQEKICHWNSGKHLTYVHAASMKISHHDKMECWCKFKDQTCCNNKCNVQRLGFLTSLLKIKKWAKCNKLLLIL